MGIDWGFLIRLYWNINFFKKKKSAHHQSSSSWLTQQYQHSLSAQNTWSGKDGTFDYQDFAHMLFKVFELDEEWTDQTIWHWNV